MISSECSSHFKTAYNDYKSAEKQIKANQETNKQKSFNHHNENHQSLYHHDHHSNINGDKLNKVIRRFSQIPTIVNQDDDTKPNNDENNYEKDNVDIFDYHERSRDVHVKKKASLNEVPELWKRDRRHSSGFLSPIHLNSLNKKHLRKTSNPESFEVLRELSSRLQVERTSGQGKMGFDSDYGGSDDDNDDYENDDDTDNAFLSPDADHNLDSMRLSPQSGKLLERRRRLSTDNTTDRLTTLSVKKKNPPKSNRRLSVDNFVSSNTLPTHKIERLSKKPSYPTLPKIKSEFLVNQATEQTHNKTRPERERRSSLFMSSSKLKHYSSRENLNSGTLEYSSQTGKRKTSLIMEGKMRRASRIISNIDQKMTNLKDQQLSPTQNDHNKENSIEELRKCRYLRTSYNPNDLKSCPCNNCEKSASPEPSVVNNH